MQNRQEKDLIQLPNVYQDALNNLLRTSHLLEDKQRHFFKKYDLTPPQYQTLRILQSEVPAAINLNMLKERIRDKQCDVSRLVDRLQAKKLLIRKSNTSDRRSVNIFITEQGQGILNLIEEKLWKMEEPMQGLTETDINTLNDLLYKIKTKP